MKTYFLLYSADMTHSFFLQIPLTRVLLWSAFIAITTSYLFLLPHNFWQTTTIMLSIILGALIATQAYKQLLCLILTGGLVATISIWQITSKKNDFYSHQKFLEKPLIIRGQIQAIQHNLQDYPTTLIRVQTSTVYNKETGKLTQPKTISLQLPYKRAKYLKLGQHITLYKVHLEQPKPEQEYTNYLIKEGIWATAFLTTENLNINKAKKINWYYRSLNFLQTYFEQSTAHLYNPLFLGKREKDQTALTIQHQSLYWGIAHHMARSGIHLVTLLGLCITLFHYARIRTRLRFALYGALVILYGYISIINISFMRALMMIQFQMFAKLHGYQYSGIHAFALTTCIVVLSNPYVVLFLDFQLSFGITAVILWLFYIKWAKTVAFPWVHFIPS